MAKTKGTPPAGKPKGGTMMPGMPMKDMGKGGKKGGGKGKKGGSCGK